MRKEYISPFVLVRDVNVKNSMLNTSNPGTFDKRGTAVNGARNTTELFNGDNNTPGDLKYPHEIGVDNNLGDDIWGSL